MKAANLLGAVLALLAVTVMGSPEEACEGTPLPPTATRLLKSSFPGWRVKTLADLEPYYRRLWTKHHPADCPGVAAGHFESRGSLSYAVILVPPGVRSMGFKVVVLTESQDHRRFRERVVLDDHESDSSRHVVARVPPGRYCDAEGLNCINSSLDAFNLEYLESGILLYYFDRATFKSLQISD
jgi:hypothetical protein